MRDYIRKFPDTSDRRQELAGLLEASEGRIRYYEYQLDADAGTLSAAKYDQLLAECNSECRCYNQLEEELETVEKPKKSPENKEKRRKLNRERREKINY